MARVNIYTVDGEGVEVQQMPDADAMGLVEAWTDGEPHLTVTLDEAGVTHIASQHIVRIDVDES